MLEVSKTENAVATAESVENQDVREQKTEEKNIPVEFIPKLLKKLWEDAPTIAAIHVQKTDDQKIEIPLSRYDELIKAEMMIDMICSFRRRASDKKDKYLFNDIMKVMFPEPDGESEED